MSQEWNSTRHKEAREWAKGGGAKSRELGAALDEIERLEEERDRIEERCRVCAAFTLG